MAALLLGVVGAQPSFAATSTNGSKWITIHPRRGIGVVRLGETKHAVDHALGTGHLQHRGTWDGWYRYSSGKIRLEVSYGTDGRVDGVDTTSRRAVIYGHPLSQGLAKLRPILKAHGWTVASCQGETFTFREPGGPGTGIAWRAGKLDDVQIDAGGSIGEPCLP